MDLQSESVLNNTQCGFAAIYVVWLLSQMKTCHSRSPESNFKESERYRGTVNTRQHLNQCVVLPRPGTCLLSYHPH